MVLRKPPSNDALIACLEAIRPEDLSFNAWLREAGVASSFFTNLRRGSEPSIYKIERLAHVAGMSLPEFWKLVEQRRPS